MTDFLLELRSEEIPARMQGQARDELQILFRRQLAEVGVDPGFLVTVWSTPRRLTLISRDLPSFTEAVSEEVKGPPDGAPDAAIDGFCRKAGVSRASLELRDVKGRMTYFAVIDQPGRSMAEVLSQAIPTIIRDFNWPKSMRWGDASLSTESLKWVRPLQGIVALLGDEVVPCEIAGIASGRETMGHRFHSTGPISIENAATYADQLRQAHVIIDHQERQQIIRDAAAAVARDSDLKLVADEGLVIENAGLTEWPVPLLGRFDEAFLSVPPEVIQLTARVNQKYFVCADADGKLANAFICTANIDAADGGAKIIDGNRKVLAARLSDAKFFYDTDLKVPLEEQAQKLDRIVFHEKLGTVADKVARVAKLARWLVEEGIVPPSNHRHPRAGGDPASSSAGADAASATGSWTPAFAGVTEEGGLTDAARAELATLAERAALLCKADLVTGMVGEFPELQGLMGGYYAAAQGLDPRIAAAIRDHYKPVGQGDDVPTDPVTVAVSLADKLDSLSGFFIVSEIPTGSRDPFALRRAALGCIALMFGNRLRLPLSRVLQECENRHFLTDLTRFAEDLGQTGLQDYDDRNYRVIIDAGLRKLYYGNKIIDVTPWLEKSRVYQEVDWDLTNNDLLLYFFADRLKVQQREAGVRHDLIDAVFALGGEDDLVRLLARVHALQAFIGTPDGVNLLAGYKRAANILKKEAPASTPAKAGVQEPQAPSPATLDPRLRGGTDGHGAIGLPYTPEPAEAALISALDAAEPAAAAAVAQEDFEGAMAALASLRAPIDAFFETVIVNDPDPTKRAARLAMLEKVRNAVHGVADFSKIEG